MGADITERQRSATTGCEQLQVVGCSTGKSLGFAPLSISTRARASLLAPTRPHSWAPTPPPPAGDCRKKQTTKKNNRRPGGWLLSLARGDSTARWLTRPRKWPTAGAKWPSKERHLTAGGTGKPFNRLTPG